MDSIGAVACGCEVPPRATDWLRIGLGVVISGQLMVLSLALNLSAVEPDTHTRLSAALLGLTALGTWLLAPDLRTATRRALARGDVALEAMFLLALAGGLGASLWGLWTGGDVFFEVVTVVLTVHALGARLKERFWSAALARAELPIPSLRVGEEVALSAGDRVPADAVVLDGAAWLDTSALDGRRMPELARRGDGVPGGAIVRRGHLRAEIRRPPEEGDHARALIALIEASARDLPTVALARRASRAFAPTVAAVALAAGAAWTWTSGIGEGFRVATAVLLVACPCGLGVATPIALWAAAAGLAARGVRVRRLGALEALGEARTVFLDKTGTLTTILPEARWQGILGSPPLEQVRMWVGAIERCSSHPVAAALRSADASREVRVDEVFDLPGGGVAARVLDAGTTARVEISPRSDVRGAVVRVDGVHVASIALHERLADDARQLVHGLRRRRIEVEVLTGDPMPCALGVPCRTALRPSEKAEQVRAGSGPVVFVGDAANDLPALAEADVSVTVSGARAAVAEHVDVFVERPSDLLAAVDTARATRRRIRALLTGSALANLVGTSVAAAGLLHPVLAALLMTGSSLGVTLAAVPRGAHGR